MEEEPIGRSLYVSHWGGQERLYLVTPVPGRDSRLASKLLLTRPDSTRNKDCGLFPFPLHSAAARGDLEVVKILMDEESIDVNETNESGESPLHCAIKGNSPEVIVLLLKHGADVNCAPFEGGQGYTLRLACKHGSRRVVKMLLKRDAVNMRDRDGLAPLHIAAKFGRVRIVKDLLSHGASINAREKTGLTPLLIAMKAGQKKVAKLLLQNGAPVDDLDESGRTVLHFAVDTKDSNVVKNVLTYSPVIKTNKTSLQNAVCKTGGEGIVEALLEYGFKVEPKDRLNSELLLCAVGNGHLKILRDLLKYGASVKAPKGLLHRAVENQHEEAVKLLLSYGADVNGQDDAGKKPIFYAVQAADWNLYNLLLAHGSKDRDDPELLHTAVRSGCINIVDDLSEHTHDLDWKDEENRTALIYALARDIKQAGSDVGKIAKLLLSKNVDTNVRALCGSTSLHFAAVIGSVDMIEALLEHGANVNSKIRTFLMVPSEVDYFSDDEVLKEGETGRRAAHDRCLDRRGSTALHIAAARGHLEAVESLLKHGCNINWRRTDGKTALHLASIHGRAKVVETLLEHGCDLSIRTWEEYSYKAALCLTSLRTIHVRSNRYRRLAGLEAINVRSNRFLRLRETVVALERHVLKMTLINSYVSEQSFQKMSFGGRYIDNLNHVVGENDEITRLEEEIASMKAEMIGTTKISFYDLLIKSANTLASFTKNESVLEVLKSGSYALKFPAYAPLVKSNLIKGLERKQLLEGALEMTSCLFFDFGLPSLCLEIILGHLTNDDLMILAEGEETRED